MGRIINKFEEEEEEEFSSVYISFFFLLKWETYRALSMISRSFMALSPWVHADLALQDCTLLK